MKALKIIFSLAFLVLSFIWIWFTVETFFPNQENLQDFYFLHKWEWFKTNIIDPINLTLQDSEGQFVEQKENGYRIVLVSVSILLLYNMVMFPIQKIPFLGNFIKIITGAVSLIAIVGIIVGGCLWGGVGLPFDVPNIPNPTLAYII
ncbi:MAG: hypothetical protein ACRCVI_02385 [Mycoplasmoidaceae bacterium]